MDRKEQESWGCRGCHHDDEGSCAWLHAAIVLRRLPPQIEAYSLWQSDNDFHKGEKGYPWNPTYPCPVRSLPLPVNTLDT